MWGYSSTKPVLTEDYTGCLQPQQDQLLSDDKAAVSARKSRDFPIVTVVGAPDGLLHDLAT